MGAYEASDRVAIASAQRLIKETGCQVVKLEGGVPAAATALIVAKLEVSTIGIGAVPATAGQVLVLTDLLGLTTGRKPKFAKPFAGLHGEMVAGVGSFAAEVRAGGFPSAA